ncbi:hypothetical protein Ade02nite_29180 [Paractinoplanes deccanensis]|uniref:Legume lectin domain-containing protein n=1 Tax=Paractinoplanes deccanensis TaxID=113561 RepID=A0ABQ3Y2P8_9ACTN|nr:L-type lectin-domain containing protein [Actinoplanes deccanensis]GID74277.1 hypothetical protein Ade02nite_29180 [Actinoplanes deccanensis]
MSRSVIRKVVTGGLLAAAVAAAPQPAAAASEFPFADVSLNGTAGLATASESAYPVLRLTGGGYRQAGSAWSNQQVDVTSSFSSQFRVHLHEGTRGADGVAFVLQSEGPRALGGWGGGLGYRGIRHSVAVELDDFRNPGDPSADHAAIVLRGNPDYHLAAATTASPLFGQPVDVGVAYDAAARRLTVSVNGQHLLAETVDLAAELGSTGAWAGFTGATGSTKSTQDILSWSVS